ncbi:hypothetical protein pb186bvf_016676 [Paramecium bursaria]
MKYLQHIKKADLFGVNYKPKITLNEHEQQSVLGGCITIALYSICFAYFLYVIVQWQIGKILPGTSTISRAVNYQEFTYNHTDLFELQYWRYNPAFMDPFDPQNIVLLPIAFVFMDGTIIETKNLLTNETKISEVLNARNIKMDSLKLVQNVDSQLKSDTPPQQEVLITLVACNEKYLNEGQKCANQTDITRFWEQGVQYIGFWLNLNQFNIYTKQIETVKKKIYISFEETSNLNGQFILKPVQLTTDDGFLFENINVSNFISDASILTATTSKDYLKKMLGLQTYFSIFLRIDPIIEQVQVTYPKLGQVLAEVGSISSTLLMIRVIIILVNQHILDERIIKRIIKMQHPFLQLDKEPKLNLNKLKPQAKQKLIITEIIYDIIKIQNFLEHRFGKLALSDSDSRISDSESSIIRIVPHQNVRYKSVG